MRTLASAAMSRAASGVPEGAVRRFRSAFGGTGRSVLPFLVLTAVWWAVKILLRLNSTILPSPVEVASSSWPLVREGILVDDLSASLGRLLVGSALGILVGVSIGLLIGSNRLVSVTFRPFLNALQGVSGIAWLPMAVIWLGYRGITIEALILYGVLSPVIFNTVIGVRTVPVRYADAVRVLGGGRWYVFFHVWLPGALPSILQGIRLGIAYGWRAVIAAEMLMSIGGIGYLLFESQTFHQTSRIVLGMAIIGLLWVFMDQAFLRPIERFTVERWGMVQR